MLYLGDQEYFSRYGPVWYRRPIVTWPHSCTDNDILLLTQTGFLFFLWRVLCLYVSSMLMKEEDIKPGAAGHVTTCFSFCCRRPTAAAVAHMMLMYVLLSRCHLPAAFWHGSTTVTPCSPACRRYVPLPPTLPPPPTGCWAAVQLALPCCCFDVTPPVTYTLLPILLCCCHLSTTDVTSCHCAVAVTHPHCCAGCCTSSCTSPAAIV